MLRTIAAARLINRAADAFEHDHDPWKASELLARAFQVLQREASDLARLHTGRAYQLQAEILLSRGELDACLDAYAEAESLFRTDPKSRVLYVRLIHDAVLTLAAVGMDDIARHYVAKGRAAAAHLPGGYKQDFARIALVAEDCTQATFESLRRRIIRSLRTAQGPRERRSLLHKLAKIQIEFGAATDIRTSYDTVARLYEDSNTLEQRIASLTPLAYCAIRPLEPMPERLLSCTGEIVRQLTAVPEDLQAEAHLIRAIALWSHSKLQEALDAALYAVALSDTCSWRVGASVVRLMTRSSGTNARYVALRLACELGEAKLAAELIETARLPALPDPSATARTTSVMTAGRRPAEVLKRALRPLHPVRVSGESRMQAYYPETLPLSEPLHLEDQIRKIGGERSWWWAGWLGPSNYRFWVTRNPDGIFSCGYQGDERKASESKLLKRGLTATPAMSTSIPALAAGEFTRNYPSEEALSTQLGAMLIPEPLRVGLNTVKQAGLDPLSLVVAGNYLSLLPLPLLVAGTSSNTQPERLLELAVIRIAPPVAIIAELGPVAMAVPPYPLAVTCSDPTSNLEFATFSDDAQHVLGGERICQDNPKALRATRANLVRVLMSLSSPAAVFAYSGHAGEGAAGADLESYLPLADGGAIHADSLFARTGEAPMIPFPERALLAACGSAGSAGSGRGEWLGLGAGVLMSGARELVATAWPIWDTKFTREFDAAVLAVLRNAADVAEGLRDTQLQYLARWRSSSADHSDGKLKSSSAEALPLIWAAYQYIGLKRS
jgi:tetratricopeptide (TPR) repeat protein